MTNFQKVFSVALSLCFFVVLAVVQNSFFLRENVYRQLPLYCFLEDKAARMSICEDRETYEKIVAANAEYLGKKVREEQRNADAEILTAELEKENLAEKQTAEKEVKKNKAAQETAAAALVQPHPVIDLSPERLLDFNYLLGQFFIVDPKTATNQGQLNAARFLEKDMTMKQDVSAPQILIYHSHAMEAFADSREGEEEDTIVGVGNYLEKILMETYGYNVLHIKEAFDMAEGTMDRSAAYDYAREYLESFLIKNPSIEVIIDMHRDGVPKDRHLVTQINGKNTAQILFYNGLSYTVNQGAVDYLPNPYIEDNLAFSFQMEYQAAQYYPDFYRGIYLAGYRYNLHLRPKAMLLEAGAQTNTVQEVKNAMEPFADILNRVLKGGDK